MNKAASIRSIAVVGLGTIGMRWAAVFAHAGLHVHAQDPDPGAWDGFQQALPGLLAELQRLQPAQAPAGALRFSADIAEAVCEADFVQENAPERMDVKRQVLQAIDAAAPARAIVASSSSALRVSDFQQGCAHPERIVLGHPFNPAHIMPLVEVAGGALSAPEAVDGARRFYESIGKKPVVMRRELAGHLALRLMGAMWREAIALVAEGSASVEDIDRAFRYGPGPKWTLQGSFISNHLGAEGLESFLEKYGPTYEMIWDDLRPTPRLDAATRVAMIAGTRAAIGARSDAQLKQERDEGLIELLALQRRHGV